MNRRVFANRFCKPFFGMSPVSNQWFRCHPRTPVALDILGLAVGGCFFAILQPFEISVTMIVSSRRLFYHPRN